MSTFEKIYTDNYKTMYRVAYRMVGDREDVSDIIQEIFIDFFNKTNNGNIIHYPKSWLFRATVNKCIDNRRNRKQFQNIESIAKDKIDWAKNYISVAEQKDIQQKAIDKYKNMDYFNYSRWLTPEKNTITAEENKFAQDMIVKQMEDDLNKISEPLPLPTFSTILKDSDGNLLFFEFPKEENANKFNVWVYDNGGKFVCQSSFVCDDYKLEINPAKMVFSKGYIYGLQLLKNANGVPLRLVRFKIVNS